MTTVEARERPSEWQNWLPHWREAAVWLVVIAGVLNFTPSLFTAESVSEAPVWTKAVKNLPVLLLLAVAVAEVGGRIRSNQSAATKRLGFAVLAMCGFLVLRSVIGGSPSAGHVASGIYYVVYPLLAVALAGLAFTVHQFRRLLVLLVALGTLQGLLAIPDFFGVFGHTYYAATIPIGGERYSRAIGTLGNPNNLGLFLGLCLIVASSKATPLRRWIRFAVIAVMLVGLLLTFSKTAALALTLASFFLTTGTLRRRVLVVGVAVAAAVGFLLLSTLVRSDFRVTEAPPKVEQPAPTPTPPPTSTPTPTPPPQTASEAALGSRGESARRALGDWTEDETSFLVGNGFASLADVDSRGRLRENIVDNMPLALAVEGGLVGLLLFVGLVALAVWPIFRATRQPGLDVVRTFAVFFLLYAPIAINFRLFPSAVFFWVLLGISLSMHLGASRGRP